MCDFNDKVNNKVNNTVTDKVNNKINNNVLANINENFENISNIAFQDLSNLNILLNNKYYNISNINNIFEKINQYEKLILKFKKTLNKIEIFNTNIKIIYSYKLLNIRNKFNNNTFFNSNLNSEIDTNKNLYINYKNITNLKLFENKEYAKCPIIEISENNLDFILNTPIYLITETQEYCIKINNKLIRGNIGDIFNDKECKKNNANKIRKCKKINCDNKYYNTNCRFYHDTDVRNFPNYSWKYTNNKDAKILHNNNKLNIVFNDIENTRNIGSLDTLYYDLYNTNKYERDLRNKQLMHDILLYQVLDQFLDE